MKNIKKTRKTKVEKRRLAFEKRNVKKEMNLARYGAEGGSALVMAKTGEFNRRFVAAFMALVFAISFLVVGFGFVGRADDSASATAEETPINSNLVLDKQLSVDENGNYTLQLSAYAKGVIRDVDKKIPTDYILVVDQSGSMSNKDMPTDYIKVDQTEWHMSDIQQDYDVDSETDSATAYYYYDESSGDYYRVYKKWGTMYELVPRNSTYVEEVIDTAGLSWWRDSGAQEQSFDCQYYYRPASDPLISKLDNTMTSDTHFYPLQITCGRGQLTYFIKFTYKDINNNPHTMRGYNNPDNYVKTDRSKGEAIYYINNVGGGINRYDPWDRLYNQINNVVVRVARGSSVVQAALQINKKADVGPFDQYTYAQIELLNLNTGMAIQNPIYIGHVGYNQLCYKDGNGKEHKLINTRFCDSSSKPLVDGENEDGSNPTEVTWNGELYTIKSENGNPSTETRLSALNHSLKEFVAKVASEEDYNHKKVDHRIAIVGFSSENTTSYNYNNNELLSGVDLIHGSDGSMSTVPNQSSGYSLDGKTHNGVQYSGSYDNGLGGISLDTYYNSLVSTATSDGQTNTVGIDNLTSAIDSITAYGGTQPAIGLRMAANIIDSRDQKDSSHEDRNTVVIFFTDGRPGNYSYVNQYDEANKVVYVANDIKQKGASIYSIGVFNEADGNPLTYSEASFYFRPVTNPTQVSQEEKNNNHWPKDYTIAGKTYYFSTYRYNPILDANTGYSQKQEDRLRATYYRDYVRQEISDESAPSQLSIPYLVYKTHWAGRDGWENDTSYATYYWGPDRDFFRECYPNTYGYPEEQNDTIADYMSVVSSEYPGAYGFSGTINTTYDAMIQDVRGNRDLESGRFYYTGSSGKNLDNIFKSIAISITESGSEIELSSTNSYLQDVLSANFEKTDDTIVTAQTYYGWMDTDTATEPRWGSDVVDTIPEGQINWVGEDEKALQVEGFDYTANYIAFGKNKEAGNLEANRGKKLVVTITNLKPSATANSMGANTPDLPTNSDNSGIFQKGETGSDRKIDLFESPTIRRYAYKLNAADCSDETFNVEYTLQKTGSSDSEQAVVIRDDATAKRYDQLTNNKFTSNESHGSKVYVEYITNHGKNQTADPADYTLSVTVTPADTSDQYTYYLGTENYPEQSDSNQLPGRNPVELSSTPSSENALYINRKDNNRIVTIHLNAEESPYVDNNYEFKVNVTWTKDGQTGSQTLTMPYNNGRIADKTVSVPYGANVTVSHEDYFYDTQISKVSFNQGTPEPVTIENISADRDIFITDKARSNIGEGIPEETKPTRVLLYSLAGLAMVSAGAGAAYVYRKKDEFVEQ